MFNWNVSFCAVVVVVIIGCGFLWFKHISLWFDAKSIDGFSHFTWVPKNIMDVCNCECDYIYSLFTSSRYWLASMTRCLFQRNENEKKRNEGIKKNARTKNTRAQTPLAYSVYRIAHTCVAQHSTPYTVRCTPHSSRIRTLCPIIVVVFFHSFQLFFFLSSPFFYMLFISFAHFIIINV